LFSRKIQTTWSIEAGVFAPARLPQRGPVAVAVAGEVDTVPVAASVTGGGAPKPALETTVSTVPVRRRYAGFPSRRKSRLLEAPNLAHRRRACTVTDVPVRITPLYRTAPVSLPARTSAQLSPRVALICRETEAGGGAFRERTVRAAGAAVVVGATCTRAAREPVPVPVDPFDGGRGVVRT
jgi:hypothetical protein